MKLAITVLSVIAASSICTASANEFAHVRRWSIESNNGTCTASTVADGTSLTFELEPAPVLTIQNPRWRIPAGLYPVGLSFLGDKDVERDMTVPAHVYSRQPNRIVIAWERAEDVSALIGVSWLRFHVGPHDFTFLSDASDVADLLPTCVKARHRTEASLR
ncbi:hypothetical protein [Acidisphaera sp. L21]|uniref:hypothetical protein n=1 Tax=Acidisphaera sp. L21 TaxID=1641851 RepID=UPI00131E979B|nr:hypothetical protein [Acidisphaera sp. L21]